MSVVLAANIFGVDVPVESVTSYYYESDGTWTADVVLVGDYSAFVPVHLLSVYMPNETQRYGVNEDCAICREMAPLQCDKHFGRI